MPPEVPSHQHCRDLAGCDGQSLVMNEEGTNLLCSHAAVLLPL